MCSLRSALAALAILSTTPVGAQNLPEDGSVSPFPPKPSSSIAGPTLQESKLAPFPAENHLPEGAPNILIILLEATALSSGGML